MIPTLLFLVEHKWFYFKTDNVIVLKKEIILINPFFFHSIKELLEYWKHLIYTINWYRLHRSVGPQFSWSWSNTCTSNQYHMCMYIYIYMYILNHFYGIYINFCPYFFLFKYYFFNFPFFLVSAQKFHITCQWSSNGPRPDWPVGWPSTIVQISSLNTCNNPQQSEKKNAVLHV